MRLHKIIPDAITLNILITTFANQRDIPGMLEIFQEINLLKITVSQVTWTILLTALSSNSHKLDIMKKMDELKIGLDSVSLTVIINIFLQLRPIFELEEFTGSLQSFMLTPSVINIIIKGFLQIKSKGGEQLAWRFLFRCFQEGRLVDSLTLNAFLIRYSTEARYRSCWTTIGLFADLFNVTPDRYTIQILARIILGKMYDGVPNLMDDFRLIMRYGRLRFGGYSEDTMKFVTTAIRCDLFTYHQFGRIMSTKLDISSLAEMFWTKTLKDDCRGFLSRDACLLYTELDKAGLRPLRLKNISDEKRQALRLKQLMRMRAKYIEKLQANLYNPLDWLNGKPDKEQVIENYIHRMPRITKLDNNEEID
ncbi:Pentatricopeptide repeat-containing protein [Neolecta irregularis DAH-3]|uniref:Pentatricopeptide repeat-containing protein n=1 Tax=Neolecta irregularis (strain DAH-3) TaxID=1198029 RepID=A0A1U7LKI0_NEOID|nr:Pentatricopeptide repeat-containing protein [Neolecta irregularis DAH-3]|eukprot:OLL23157.1 Pentatricopeptide repeat-containing protein [Neolecta irregularis DAH-3]